MSVDREKMEDNWPKTVGFGAKLMFFRDIGDWPGVYGREATTLHVQSIIDQERAGGKGFCAEQKLKRALAVGLDVH